MAQPARPSARPKLRNADPLVETVTPEPSPPQMDYPAHVATYNSFLSLIKWFSIHMCLIVPALYFFIIAGMPGVGFALLGSAIALLIWGLLRTPKVNRDVSVAADLSSSRAP
jgi:hypothetical protein